MSPQIDHTEQVLESLNETLKAELTAIHQYLLHAKVCQNWGYLRLAEYNRKESIEELAHAEALMERILFLRATPNMTDLSPIKECNDAKEQLESDLALEMDAVDTPQHRGEGSHPGRRQRLQPAFRQDPRG